MKNNLKNIKAFIFNKEYFFDILATSILILFLLIVFYFPIFKGIGTIQWDAQEVHLTNLIFSSRLIQEGKIPLWTPYIFNGFPQIADPQVAIFYPINLIISLFAVFTPNILMGQIIFHYFLAGFFMYIFVRFLLKDKFISLFAAIAYMFCGFMVGHASHVGMQNTVTWLPLLFLFLMSFLEKKKVFLAVIAGLILGILILAGHFQTMLYAVFAATLFFLFDLIFDWRENRSLKFLLKKIWLFLVTAFVAFLISAVQLIPSYELMNYSQRQDISLAFSQTESLLPKSLITLLNPDFYGAASGNYKGPWDRTQNYLYLGTSTLVLALIGIIYSKRKKLIIFYSLLILISFLYALGKNGGIQPIFYNFVPFFNKIRAPVNMMLLFDFGVIILAAFGFEVLKKRFSRQSFILGLFLVALIGGELLALTLPNTLLYARESPKNILNVSASPAHVRDFKKEYSKLNSLNMFRMWRISGLDRNQSQVFKIYAADGYNPLMLQRYGEYIDAMVKNKKLMELASIKYFPCDYGGICESSEILERAIFVPNFIAAKDKEDALRLIQEVNPKEALVVEKELTAALDNNDAGGTVFIQNIEDKESLLKYRVDFPKDGFLFMNQTFYPGWKAYVDSKPIEVLRANFLFQAIKVPKGAHEVILNFQPISFKIGLLLTMMGILIIAIFAIFEIIRKLIHS